MGPRLGVILVSGLLSACGGQSGVREQGDPGAAIGGEGGATSLDCQYPAEEYVERELAACSDTWLQCPAGSAVFADECGCGCDRTPFEDDEAAVPVYSDVVEQACGLDGPLAMFDRALTRLVIGESAVFAWVDRPGRMDTTDVWVIDKRTGAMSLLSPDSPEPESMAGSVVSDASGFEGDGAGYYTAVAGSLVRESQAGLEVLFELPGESTAFVVIDREVYSTAEDGALRRGLVSPTVEPPLVVEQRGILDEDDYALIVAADEDAVYWTSGPAEAVRVSDGDPLMLYRHCR